jgi:DNA-binding IclR family transcriptional regulator
VSAAVLVDDEIEYIDRYESDMLLRVSIDIGTRFSAYCTGTGKILLSALSDSELTQRFKGKARLKKCTDKSVSTMKELREVLDGVRRQGVARDLEECLVGVHCLAAPIVNHQGEVVAAVSISGPRERLTIEKMDELEPLLRKATEKISQEFTR